MSELDAAIGSRESELRDSIWTVLLFATVLGVAVPWFLRALDVELGPLVWGLAGFVLARHGLSRLRRAAGDRTGRIIEAGRPYLGVAFCAWLWWMLGGLAAPIYAAMLLLPLVAGSLGDEEVVILPTGLATLIALWFVAWTSSADLRWYFSQLGWSLPAPPAILVPSAEPFPGFRPLPSYLFAATLAVSSLIVGFLLLSWHRRATTSALHDQIDWLHRERDQADTVARELIRRAPVPLALVVAGSGQIVDASDAFLDAMMVSRADLAGQSLVELAEFAYPEGLYTLLEETGTLPATALRLGEEERLIRLRSVPIGSGSRWQLVTLEDVGEVDAFGLALDALPDAVLIFDPASRVLHANAPARRLLPDLAPGLPAAEMPDLERLLPPVDDSLPYRSGTLETAEGPAAVSVQTLPRPGGASPVRVVHVRLRGAS